jgi:hypothetical protein
MANVRLRDGLAALRTSMFPDMPHCFQPAGTHSTDTFGAGGRRGPPLGPGTGDGAQRHTRPPTRRTPSGSAITNGVLGETNDLTFKRSKSY